MGVLSPRPVCSILPADSLICHRWHSHLHCSSVSVVALSQAVSGRLLLSWLVLIQQWANKLGLDKSVGRNVMAALSLNGTCIHWLRLSGPLSLSLPLLDVLLLAELMTKSTLALNKWMDRAMNADRIIYAFYLV